MRSTAIGGTDASLALCDLDEGWAWAAMGDRGKDRDKAQSAMDSIRAMCIRMYLPLDLDNIRGRTGVPLGRRLRALGWTDPAR
ncbi:protein of unknown function [Azospirillum baldaniorum]|uniref:Uncharacterized protein n=1 Tax=Azospirillum baldaniorum TaxID=1064539 RepID=A0A9P1JPR5_9PROT|nr:protein of unknown function [Azospirillum baldaniorum]